MIRRLYVHNYGCLENFVLDLTDTPYALLLGRNGAGKSTVFECFKIFQRICRGTGRTRDLISADDFSQRRTDSPMRFEIDVQLGDRRIEYEISFEWPPKFREARILEERLTTNGQVVFTRQHSQIQIASGATFGLDWHVIALTVVNEPSEQEPIQTFKSFLAGLILVAPVPAEMSGFSDSPSMELLGTAGNLASCLRGLLGQKPAAYAIVDQYLKSVMPDFASLENVDRGSGGTELTIRFEQPPSSSLTLGFERLSDGEKCFLLNSYILARNAVGLPVFCMWDEPDNHLALPEIGGLVTSLRKLAHRGGQFIATSHHPETIRRFSDDSTIVLQRKSHLEPTVARRLSELSYTGDLVNSLIRGEIIGEE